MADATGSVEIQSDPIPEPFDTDELLWFRVGKWGDAGYAIPNPGGKLYTNNSVIYAVHKLIGRELFGLMHRADVKFSRPPGKEFLYDVHKMLVVARKRLADRSVAFNADRVDGQHATPAPKTFLLYPVPHFGERIRQDDVAEWGETILLTLSEIMQHSDNEFDLEITDLFVADISKRLQRILVLLATKFFGFSRADALKPDFVIPDAKFATYDPGPLFVTSELTEERPPLRWWPTENDLSKIRGIPADVAILNAQRWPGNVTAMRGDGGSLAATPGDGSLRAAAFVRAPGAAPPAST